MLHFRLFSIHTNANYKQTPEYAMLTNSHTRSVGKSAFIACSACVWLATTCTVLLLVQMGIISGKGVAISYAITPLLSRSIIGLQACKQQTASEATCVLFLCMVAGLIGGFFVEWVSGIFHLWFVTLFSATAYGAASGGVLCWIEKTGCDGSGKSDGSGLVDEPPSTSRTGEP